MPFVKQREKSFARLSRLLRGYAKTAELAAALDRSFPTAKARLDHPEDLTLGELKKASQRLHIPVEEIRATITW